MNKKKIAAIALSFSLLFSASIYGTYAWFTAHDTTNSFVVTMGKLDVSTTVDSVWYKIGSYDTTRINQVVTTPYGTPGNPGESGYGIGYKVAEGMYVSNEVAPSTTPIDKLLSQQPQLAANLYDNEKKVTQWNSTLAPGDTVCRYFTINNTGTIDEKVRFRVTGTPSMQSNNLPAELNNHIEFYVEDKADNGLLQPLQYFTDSWENNWATLNIPAGESRRVVVQLRVPKTLENHHKGDIFNWTVDVRATQQNRPNTEWPFNE